VTLALKGNIKYMKQIIIATVVILMAIVNSQAETLRLSARYVETSYTVHNFTGAKSNVSTREKLVKSNLEITKQTIKQGTNSLSVIKLIAKAGQKKDRSSESGGVIKFDNKEKILAILKELPRKIRDARIKPSDSSETLFEGYNIKLTFVKVAKYRTGYVDFLVGNRTFVLKSSSDISKLSKAIKAIK
jgi:hypothetical protein